MEHPSVYLKPEWVKTIRDYAQTAEEMGVLHPRQLELVHEQQWFKFFVPKKYSGLEMPLPQQVRLEESLAWANGSLGWVVTLCSGAGWFGGFIEAETALSIFNATGVCLAGSGAATGTAEMTGDGYIVTSKWNYASGIHHATHITANCVIMQNNKPVLNNDGSRLVLPFVFDKKDVEVLPAWKYIGMMATGSHAYEINSLFVKSCRSFRIAPQAAVADGPLYQYPFMQLAEATLAVNISGLAIHFTDLAAEVFQKKIQSGYWNEVQKNQIEKVLSENLELITYDRESFYHALDLSWQYCETGAAIPADALKSVSTASRQLASNARRAVDALYPYCGLMAANPDSEINQVWRDIHTASQHSLLTFNV